MRTTLGRLTGRGWPRPETETLHCVPGRPGVEAKLGNGHATPRGHQRGKGRGARVCACARACVCLGERPRAVLPPHTRPTHAPPLPRGREPPKHGSKQATRRPGRTKAGSSCASRSRSRPSSPLLPPHTRISLPHLPPPRQALQRRLSRRGGRHRAPPKAKGSTTVTAAGWRGASSPPRLRRRGPARAAAPASDRSESDRRRRCFAPWPCGAPVCIPPPPRLLAGPLL